MDIAETSQEPPPFADILDRATQELLTKLWAQPGYLEWRLAMIQMDRRIKHKSTSEMQDDGSLRITVWVEDGGPLAPDD